jgi:hypothetical protein
MRGARVPLPAFERHPRGAELTLDGAGDRLAGRACLSIEVD